MVGRRCAPPKLFSSSRLNIMHAATPIFCFSNRPVFNYKPEPCQTGIPFSPGAARQPKESELCWAGPIGFF